MDERYSVAAVRRTWDQVVGRAFEKASKVRLTAEEVRRFVSDYIENEADGSIAKRKFWDTLSDDEKQRILEKAFPEGSTLGLRKETSSSRPQQRSIREISADRSKTVDSSRSLFWTRIRSQDRGRR